VDELISVVHVSTRRIVERVAGETANPVVMAGKSPHTVVLSEEQRAELERHAVAYSGPFRDVMRAKAILYAADGPRIRRSRCGLMCPASRCRIGEDGSVRKAC